MLETVHGLAQPERELAGSCMSSHPAPPDAGTCACSGRRVTLKDGALSGRWAWHAEHAQEHASTSSSIRTTPHGGAIHLVGFYNDYGNFLAVGSKVSQARAPLTNSHKVAFEAGGRAAKHHLVNKTRALKSEPSSSPRFAISCLCDFGQAT